MVDKSKLPSRHVSVGPKSAPHRAFYYAMGITEEQIKQPFVGVVTTWNESALAIFHFLVKLNQPKKVCGMQKVHQENLPPLLLLMV